jgi:uncharacterized protein (TIGR03067 family)
MRARASRFRLAWGAALVAVCASLGCSGDADFSDAVGEITTLPAEEYQAEILELDRLAFEPTAMDDARRAKLGARFEALARRVKAAGDTRFLTLESLELRQLAAASKRMPAEQIQNQWMRIRNNLFDDRAWFARSAADLDDVAAYVPTPSPAVPTEAPAIAVDESEPTRRVTAGPPPAPELEGLWTIVEITSNGKANPDQELFGATLEIRGDRFRLDRGRGHVQEYPFIVLRDAAGSAIYLQNDPGARGENGWVLYEVSNGVLRMALYDGLGKRPSGFTAPEGTEPELIVLRLERKKS